MEIETLKAFSSLGGSVTTVGILLAMLWFFIQRDKEQNLQSMNREQLLAKRIEQLEDRYHNFMETTIKNMTAIIASNTEALLLVRRDLGHERRLHGGKWTKEEELKEIQSE